MLYIEQLICQEKSPRKENLNWNTKNARSANIFNFIQLQNN